MGLAGPLEVGVLFALVLGLLAGIGDTAPQALGPRDVIRADGCYGLVFGLVAGLTFGLVAGLTPNGLVIDLMFVVTGTVATVVTYGANAWVRYHIGVVIGAVYGSGPMRFGAFLDWGQQAGLLRLSGIAYQFRHRQIEDWLTTWAG